MDMELEAGKKGVVFMKKEKILDYINMMIKFHYGLDLGTDKVKKLVDEYAYFQKDYDDYKLIVLEFMHGRNFSEKSDNKEFWEKIKEIVKETETKDYWKEIAKPKEENENE